jgi:hypothetical protein
MPSKILRDGELVDMTPEEEAALAAVQAAGDRGAAANLARSNGAARRRRILARLAADKPGEALQQLLKERTPL